MKPALPFPSKRALAVAAAAALSISLTGCGSSDTTDSTTEKTTEKPPASTEPTLTSAQEATCSGLVDASKALLNFGGPPGPTDKQLTQLTTLYTTLEAGLTGDEQIAAGRVSDTITEAIETKNKKLLDDDSFFGSLLAPAAAGRTLCAFAPVDFMTHDKPAPTPDGNPEFTYMGLPKELDAGTTNFGLKNDTDNFHEAIVMKVNDGFTGSVEDWTMLDDKAQEEAVETQSITFAPPHATTYENVDLTSGRYFVICHIPLTEGNGKNERLKIGPRGPIWHFTIGMAEEVMVS